MAKRVQRIGQSGGAATSFVGLDREITVDNDNNSLRIHDGATAGGFETAKADASNLQQSTNSLDGKMSAAQAALLIKLDLEIGGVFNKILTGDYTLINDEPHNLYFIFTGALVADATITFPDEIKLAIIENGTTGGFNLIVETVSGTATVTAEPGRQTFCRINNTFDVVTLTDAVDIQYDPSGAAGLTANNVQAAIDELDADLIAGDVNLNAIKADLAGDTFTGRVTGTSLRLTDTGAQTLPGDAHAFQVGSSSVVNLGIDTNGISVRNNGAASTLFLNSDGGDVVINLNLAWHQGNDGAGSGLDADLLDGFDHAESGIANTIAKRGAGGILNVGTPTADTHAATKLYVDSVVDTFASELFHVQDEKANTTDGGAMSPADTWLTRDLNTVKTNEITSASLAANQIILPAGTYYIDAIAPALDVDRHRIKLRNITDSTDELLGINSFATTAGIGGTNALLQGRFTIAAQKTFELQHRGNVERLTDGLGSNSSFGVVEIYTVVKIWKIN